MVVPAFRRVDRYHPGPDQTSRSGAMPRNAWTHRHTDKHQPPNFFSPTHRRKSSFIRTCYAKALAPFILYDFGLETGIAKHCLGVKIVDIAMFKFNCELVFTAKVPFHSGGSSIEADKALPHPQSPRSNTLQYFYLQYSKMRCIVK